MNKDMERSLRSLRRIRTEIRKAHNKLAREHTSISLPEVQILEEDLEYAQDSVKRANDNVFPEEQVKRKEVYEALIQNMRVMLSLEDEEKTSEEEDGNEEESEEEEPKTKSASSSASVTDIVAAFPKFTGDVLKWPAFKRYFEQCVVLNPGFGEFEKRALIG